MPHRPIRIDPREEDAPPERSLEGIKPAWVEWSRQENRGVGFEWDDHPPLKKLKEGKATFADTVIDCVRAGDMSFYYDELLPLARHRPDYLRSLQDREQDFVAALHWKLAGCLEHGVFRSVPDLLQQLQFFEKDVAARTDIRQKIVENFREGLAQATSELAPSKDFDDWNPNQYTGASFCEFVAKNLLTKEEIADPALTQLVETFVGAFMQVDEVPLGKFLPIAKVFGLKKSQGLKQLALDRLKRRWEDCAGSYMDGDGSEERSTQKAKFEMDKLLNSFDIAVADVLPIHTNIFLHTLEEGKCAAAFKYRDLHDLGKAFRSPEARVAARKGLMKQLVSGEQSEVIALRDAFSLQDDMTQADARSAALISIEGDFQQGRIAPALSLARLVSLPDKDIVAAMSELLQGARFSRILPELSIIPEGVLRLLDRQYFLLQYRDELNIDSMPIYEEYVRFKKGGDHVKLRGFIHQIQERIDGLMSSKTEPESMRNEPYYHDLIQHVYQNNAGDWTTFESNESCPDRTVDLKNYKIENAYRFSIAPGTDMELRAGQEADPKALESIEQPIRGNMEIVRTADFDQEKIKAQFDERIAAEAKKLEPAEAFKTREEKLFGLMLETAAGRYSSQAFKQLLIAYQFATFEDIRHYVEGTRGRSEQAKNPNYAYLLELHEFYADRLKEVSRHLSDRALKNPALQALLPRYHREISAKAQGTLEQGAINKLRIETLGLAAGFVKEVTRRLRGVTKREDLSEAEAIEMIAHYEQRMVESREAAKPPEGSDLHPAVYGLIRSQRQKTIQALEVLQGTSVNPAEVRLGTTDLAALVAKKQAVAGGAYDEASFAAYLAERFQETFRPELNLIDAEVAKYVPKETEKKGVKQKRVEAFITLNHSSAHARATAGVCVSGDNPRNGRGSASDPEQSDCLWLMPNYLQMTLRDAESKRCQGCVLMHLQEDEGKKILVISPNPSSTYLYQVNESELFEQILQQLTAFTAANDIDALALSKHKQIRTNRTGGEFERAMDAKIRSVGRQHIFAEARRFSFSPEYYVDAVDIVWAKNPEAFAPRVEEEEKPGTA